LNANRRWLAAACALVALVACRQKPVAAEREPAATASAPPAVTAAPPADLATKEVTTTIALGGPELATGVRISSPPATDELRALTAGAAIRAVLQTRPLPAGYVARLLVRKGETVVETQKGATEGARSVEVSLDDTSKLEPGSWTLEVWLGGTMVEQRAIEIRR
jgi:hypothetical protein